MSINIFSRRLFQSFHLFNKFSSMSIDIGNCKEVEMKGKELIEKLKDGQIRSKDLESFTENCHEAVDIRRQYYSDKFENVSESIKKIPFMNYDYESILGQCCEEVIGYISIPVGLASPIIVDKRVHCIPMATTEGCLVASTNRGAKVTNMAGGIRTIVYNDQMTRAPVFSFRSIVDLIKFKEWVESSDGFQTLKTEFNKTSRYGNLLSINCYPAGRFLHLRFSASSGEAMGMNIISKGTDQCIKHLLSKFETAELISISGNMCTDKKSTAINWIMGRGKSVIAECRLSHEIVTRELRTTPSRLQTLCNAKNFSGSALAGSAAGGFNAHASNIVAAIFAATGQDLAQVVESSNCLTMFETVPSDDVDSNMDDLLVTCTMPSLEVGTVGGGSKLSHQRACLSLMGIFESANLTDKPNGTGELTSDILSSELFARLICSTVLCAELSLMSALDTNELVRAHLLYNRASNGST